MTRDDSFRSPYRPVRPVGAPHDGPWAGMLACLTTGERHVLVDAAVLGPQWRGWDAAADGHVLAPLDIVRRADGHDVALPVCTERVSEFLLRRARTAPLAPGEAVTLGVSILRGCAQLADRAETTGEWWLTEDGRPVMATDASDHPLLDGSTTLLTDLGGAARHPQVWADAIAALASERSSAIEIERAEHRLFELSEPVPLMTAAAGPRAARDVALREPHGASPADDRARPVLWDSLARHVDADLADLVSRATTALWRRAHKREGTSRRPWVVGGVAATAVLCVGLFWPPGDDEIASADPSDDEQTAVQVAATPDPTVTSAPTPSATAAERGRPTDLVDVTGDLLERRQECAKDAGCLAAVVQQPSARFAPGAIDLPAEERTIALLDDFGGVAVLRVDARAGEQRSQLVVIALSDDAWLLRDVHDVAQQP